MRVNRFLFIILELSIVVLFLNCKVNQSNDEPVLEPIKIDFSLDTIIEKNSPKNLDLTKHQLYLDTSRSNKHYDWLQNWESYL